MPVRRPEPRAGDPPHPPQRGPEPQEPGRPLSPPLREQEGAAVHAQLPGPPRRRAAAGGCRSRRPRYQVTVARSHLLGSRCTTYRMYLVTASRSQFLESLEKGSSYQHTVSSSNAVCKRKALRLVAGNKCADPVEETYLTMASIVAGGRPRYKEIARRPRRDLSNSFN